MKAPMTTTSPTKAVMAPVPLASPLPRKRIATEIHIRLIATNTANVIDFLLFQISTVEPLKTD